MQLGVASASFSAYQLAEVDTKGNKLYKGNVYWLTRANCRRAEKYGGIRWKGQCPFALAQHTEKFWNIFFQTFRAGRLFFSGNKLCLAGEFFSASAQKEMCQLNFLCCLFDDDSLCLPLAPRIRPMCIRHRSHHFAAQSNHFVDRAGWQPKWLPLKCGYRDLMRAAPIEGHHNIDM